MPFSGMCFQGFLQAEGSNTQTLGTIFCPSKESI